jgi:hypothetical protein
VLRGACRGYGSATIDTRQVIAIKTEPRDYGFNIEHAGFETHVVHVSIGRTHASQVVANHPEATPGQLVRHEASVGMGQVIVMDVAEDVGREH